MNLRILIIVLTISSIANSQNYIGINQTAIAVQQNQSIRNTNITYNDYNFGLSMIAGEISAFRNSWENKTKREEAFKKAQSQINLIKTNYTSSEQFPQKIIDGWHSVIVTDNYNYCSPAKVFIVNNAIKEFVIGNWIRLSYPFIQLSTIVKGKCLLNLDFDNKTDTLEVYFMYDLAEATIVDKPLSSGQISFWSDSANSIQIWFNEEKKGKGKELVKNKDTKEYSLTTDYIKPGFYSFKAKGYRGIGTIEWEGTLEVKEGLILRYELTKENSKK